MQDDLLKTAFARRISIFGKSSRRWDRLEFRPAWRDGTPNEDSARKRRAEETVSLFRAGRLS
jgi:hypothetical protein